MSKKIDLIDADSVIYILGWHAKDHQDEAAMELVLDQFMIDLITDTGATHYLGVFTPKTTFRNEIYSEYKANRKGTAPEWVSFWKPRIIKLCIDKYQFFVADNIEADDVLSIMRGVDGDVIFCSPDKDLRQIPGQHYDYSKRKWELVSSDEANLRFWTQMLTGDSTDNIPGCKGVGPKGAEKVLSLGMTWDEMEIAVYHMYQNNKKYSQTPLEGEVMPEYHIQFRLMKDLLMLRQPTTGDIAKYSQHLQAVAYSEPELNIESNEDTKVVRDSERSLEGDILCPTSDLSEQV